MLGVTGRFMLAVVLPSVLVLGLMTALVAGTTFWSTTRTDASSIQRETQLVEHLLEQRIAQVTKDQQTSTIWDDAVEHVLGDRDPDWLDSNLGVWMHDYFGIDRIFILDGDDVSIYAMIGGASRPEGSYFAHATLLQPIVDALRQQRRAGDSEEARPGFLRDYVLLENRPAVVSAAPIVSETGAIPQVAGDEPVHIAVRFLDAAFLTRLSTDFFIERPRFSWTGSVGEHEARFPLNSAGASLGYLVWTVQRPGTKIMGEITPVLSTAGGAILILAGFMLFRLHRTSKKLLKSHERIDHMARHDALTGLSNRFHFASELRNRIGEFERTRTLFAVLYLDLDRFKHVNDTLGHPAGDGLICQVSSRLKGIIRKDDVLARIGGDEFAMLVNQVANVGEVETISVEIVRVIGAPFLIDNQEVDIGVSIGAALPLETHFVADDLIRNADMALYKVKSSGRNGYAIFDEEMNRSATRRRILERDLRAALSREGELSLVYQPILRANSGTVVAVEALLCWRHPRDGIISPCEIIPLAEDAGLILPLGYWVLNAACRAGVALGEMVVAVNVSAVQLRDKFFGPTVEKILSATGMEPSRLQIEINEGALIQHSETVVQNISVLREAGIRIMIDEFGNGHASISYLKNYKVDGLKLNCSFIEALSADPEGARSAFKAIVDLACSLGLEVAAEGVETQEQMEIALAAGAQYLQGYLCSHPVALPELLETVSIRRERDTFPKRAA
ncbi:EAL domain-containing protein [Aurantimonas sp. A2-1-M11]|uniref:putative bifunctional diguanylate cyclase/phosphodiesterase n=1 Tax=Aurantimonas sp. A2-1-M11 TaxID=3113712 RepID=UPI002F92345D